MAIRAAIYVRVSTTDQNTERQTAELEAYAAFKGYDIVKRYADEGISGSKGRQQRPGLDKALKDAVRHSYDVLMVWSLDRLGRSTIDLHSTLQTLEEATRALYIHNLSIDTNTSAGRLVFGIMASIAQMEREVIGDRVRSGIARAKAKGKRLGRPRITSEAQAEIRALLRTGMTVKAVARQLKRGNDIVMAVKRELDETG